jgi:polyisoprenoid-binding protein YceI
MKPLLFCRCRATFMLLRAARLLFCLLLPIGACQAASFKIDNAHTSVHFAVSHFDRTLLRGRFDGIIGKIEFDPVAHSGALDITIDPDSVDTSSTGLDGVLKSDQFFDTEQFHFARFQSDRFIFDGDQLKAVAGQLTLHGMTLPVQLTASRFSCGEVKILLLRRHVCGGDFHATISRSAFGMRRFLPDVSDAVYIDVAIEALPIN